MEQLLLDTAGAFDTPSARGVARALKASSALGVAHVLGTGGADNVAGAVNTAGASDRAGASDPADALTRIEFGMVAAVDAQRAQWRASAEVFRAIDDTLRDAVTHPEVFLGPITRHTRDDLEFAERGAAADLAVRLSVAENTVRNQGMIARTLRHRLPTLWAQFTTGEVSPQNAREAATIADELPESLWAEFETTVIAAGHLAPARFRVRARAISEKLQTRTITERHMAAQVHRTVWTEIDRDGMGWLHAHLSAANLAKIGANLDGIAFPLFTETDETRTMAQLRADVLSELLTGTTDSGAGTGCRCVDGTRTDATSTSTSTSTSTGTGTSTSTSRKRPPVGVTVALTIPVLTLLGHSTDPALLEGVGPIDLATARRLAATAPAITRLLTDPVTGTIIDMDPHQYRVPAALKRWLAIQQVTCDFPECGRRAHNCDLDHTHAWADGGNTTAANLAHRCRKHHTMKHHTKWRVAKPPGTDRAVWTSPTSYTRETDPPPF